MSRSAGDHRAGAVVDLSHPHRRPSRAVALRRIQPRVEAGLDAVPAAVLTTLVAPALLTAGPAELAALAVAGRGGAARQQPDAMFLTGAAVLIVLASARSAEAARLALVEPARAQPRSPSSIGPISASTRA